MCFLNILRLHIIQQQRQKRLYKKYTEKLAHAYMETCNDMTVMRCNDNYLYPPSPLMPQDTNFWRNYSANYEYSDCDRGDPRAPVLFLPMSDDMNYDTDNSSYYSSACCPNCYRAEADSGRCSSPCCSEYIFNGGHHFGGKVAYEPIAHVCHRREVVCYPGNFRSGRLAVETWAGEMPATRAANGALALHYAAARGCLDCVRLLAATTPDVSANTAMDNDVTPVYLAAQEGHLEVLKYLVLEAGGKLNARAKDGMLPIHAAAQTGCLDCVKWMIMDQSVDPNSRDGDGATPLHFAASRGHLSTVRWLLRHGARLQLDRHGKSPINDAAENHHVECLNVLVAAGAGSEGKQLATYKGAHACACTPGDSRCPLPSCVNANQNRSRSPDRAPFFLHPPAIQHGTHHSQHSSQNGQHGTQHSQHGTQHSPHGTQHSQHGTQHSQHGTQHGQHVNHHGQHGKQHGQNGNQHGQHGAAQHASLAPADGLYVNPMQKKPQEVHVNSSATSNNGSASSGEESSVSSSLGTSSHGTGFYLHSPQEVIYNRVRDLFDGPGTPTSLARGRAEGQETPNGMTVKAEVHSSSSGAGSEGSESGVSEGARRDADHDYEDIYLAREDIHRQRSKSRDSGSHSRSGSASSSGGGVVIQLTPQLTTRDGAKSSVSKRSSQNGKKNTYEESHSKPSSKMNGKSPKGEKSGGSKSASSGHSTQSSAGGRQSSLSGRLSSLGAKASSFANKLASSRSSLQEEAGSGESGVSSASCSSDEAAPPPPPPPPPAPAALEVLEEPTVRPSEFINRIGARCNSSAGSSEADADGERPSRGGPNLVNKQLVLPFVPPSFPHNSASNRLIKPSEYLRSITTSSSKQSSDAEDGYTIINQMKRSDSRDRSEEAKENGPAFCPPPPPPPPPQENANNNKHQPLSSISIQDLNSVQLRRTDKMIASKTLSAPARSMSMQCLATEPFQAQKTDLIAELKMSKDITGIKKMKVERAKMENMVEKEVYSEYTKQFTTENFVDQIPERDPSGNIIPAWKRQMLARRAAERARRDLERRLAGEAERRRAMAVPAWKRQLLARREEAENRIKATIYTPKVCDEPRNGFLAHETNTDACWRSPSQYGVQQRAVSIDNINLAVDYEDRRTNGVNDNTDHHNGVNESDVKENTIVNGGKPVTNGRKHSVESGDDARIIPWRAQLRKTNSKLNLLE